MDELDSGDDLGPLFKPYLEPGETLIWSGRAVPRRFAGVVSGSIAAGVILLSISGVGLLVFDGAHGRPAAMGFLALPLPALFAVVMFAAAGIGALRHAFRLRREIPRILYAITTGRALVVNGFRVDRSGNIVFDHKELSFGPDAIRGREVKRRRRDGSGDIIFDSEVRPGRRGRTIIEAGFFGLPQVDEVNALLKGLDSGPAKMDRSSLFDWTGS